MIRRLVGAAIIAIFMTFAAPWLASSVSSPPAIAASSHYTYECESHNAAVMPAISERGPPATCDLADANDADGHRPRGASTRPDVLAPGSTTNYATPAPLALGARVTGTTPMRVQADAGAMCASSSSKDAAKSADEVAEVAANAPKITFGHGARHLQ